MAYRLLKQISKQVEAKPIVATIPNPDVARFGSMETSVGNSRTAGKRGAIRFTVKKLSGIIKIWSKPKQM